jgi:hypothetical protein
MIHSKVLLLGESPAAGTQHDPESWLAPGSSASADRLLKFTGYDAETYLRTFDRDNLLHHLPKRSGKGRSFPLSRAKRQVGRVFWERPDSNQRIVMLGRRVAIAFNWYRWNKIVGPIRHRELKYLKWYRIMDQYGFLLWAAVVPHPSGVNRWWNDANNRRRARKFFRELKT